MYTHAHMSAIYVYIYIYTYVCTCVYVCTFWVSEVISLRILLLYKTMGSRTSRTHSRDGIDPVGAPANAAPLLCCSTVSDVAGKRCEEDELTDLRELTQRSRHRADEENPLPSLHAARRAQQSRGKHYSDARKRQLTRCEAARECQCDHAVAALRQSGVGQPRKDASEVSALSVHTVAHQPIRHRSIGYQSTRLGHKQKSMPGTRAQRPRQCWTDSPHTGQGSGYTPRASTGYFPLLAIDVPHASHDSGGGDGFSIV